MNGRIYDPLLGRFLSADLVVQNPANWQFFNRYSYVQNNPLTRVDPTGFFSGGNVNCMSPQPTATGLQAMGYTSDRAALFVDFNRGIEAAAGEVFASFIPGVGQYQDLQQYREGNMSDRAALLMLFMEYLDTQSGGFMPNAGGVRRGVRRAEEGAEALERNLSRLRRAEVDAKHLSEIENLAKNSDEFKRLQFDPAVGKNRPGEALAALETQGKLGMMERAPAGSRADFVVTSGANKGKTVDLMFTPNSTTEVSKMNEHFAKNWDKTAASITEHMGKADFVVMDFRSLSTENRVQVLTYLKDNFSEEQLKKVKILLSAK